MATRIAICHTQPDPRLSHPPCVSTAVLSSPKLSRMYPQFHGDKERNIPNRLNTEFTWVSLLLNKALAGFRQIYK